VRSCPNFGQFPLSTSKPPRGLNAGQIFGQSSADPRGRTSGRFWVGSASTASSPAVSLIYSLGPLQRVSLPRDRHYSRFCSCPSQFLAEQDFTVFAISACSSRTVSSSRAVCSSQFSAATVSARQPCLEPAAAGLSPAAVTHWFSNQAAVAAQFPAAEYCAVFHWQFSKVQYQHHAASPSRYSALSQPAVHAVQRHFG
jgi:hypothetical protein